VSTATVSRWCDSPFLRVIVTGEEASAPDHFSVVVTPAVTLTGTWVKLMANTEDIREALVSRIAAYFILAAEGIAVETKGYS